MRHKKSLFVCLLLIALFMTACAGNSSNRLTAKMGNGLPQNTPSHLSKQLSKHVKLDADVVIPEGIKEVPILKADIYKIDPQKLRTTFHIKPYTTVIDKKPVVYQVEVTQNKNGSIQELAYDDLCDKNGKPMLVSDFFVNNGEPAKKENSHMIVYGGSQTIVMATEYNYTFLAFQRDSTSGSFTANWYTKKSLPFMQPSDAFSKAVKIISTLGLDVSGTHDTFCLDNQTSAELVGYDRAARHIDYVSNVYQYLVNKGNWDTYDDYYYFVLYPKYHGIPIAEGDGSSIEGGTLDVAYCERGIEYLMANTLYKEIGVLQSDVPVYGLDGALQMLKYKYDNTILTEPVTVSSIRFCYVPVPMSKNSTDYRLVPGWQFTIKKTVTDVEGQTVTSNFGTASAQTDTINIYFDATTGKEIIGSTPRL